MKTNIAIAMIDKQYWKTGTNVIVQAPDRARAAKVCQLPFLSEKRIMRKAK
jgi:glycine cleavage system aminomethyltransferase T